MNDKITSTNIKEFLKEHLENSEIILLEEGKEKNDIMEVAKAKGYILKDSTDLAGFKTIFTFADKANLNKARLPKEKLLKALPGIIGKPVDIDHIRTYVVGHYIDYRYVAKDDMVVAYGVFYKSNFGEEWAKAQQLFKAKKLGTSYEVWCPKNKRRALPDGTYELTSIEIAGGGLMFKEKPAFADALVLEVAKKNIENQSEDLVFASEKKNYDASEILTSSDQIVSQPVSTALPAGEKVADSKGPEAQVVANNMIKCSNCTKSFEDFGEVAKSEVKCPECFAILDKSGAMKYPPQIINFSLRCPGCSAGNWKLLKDTPEQASVKCMSCAKNYQVDFNTKNIDPLLTKIAFMYTGSASCHQCGTGIPFSTVNKATIKQLKCPKCDLSFSVDLAKMDKNRKITKVNQVVEDNTMHVSSEKGGQENMSQKPEEKIEQPVVEVVAPEVKAEEVKAPVAEVIPEVVAEEKPAEAVVAVEPALEVSEVSDTVEVEDAGLIEQEEILEVAKTLKAEDRNALGNDDFAVVKTVKDKKTGGTSTVRKYPIHDKAHVQNALSRLHQTPGQDGLKKLGVNVEDTITKVKAKGKKLGMEEADMQPYCVADKDTSMQEAKPRMKDDIQKANDHVAGLTPDQVNQMQNQLFAYQKAFKKMKKVHKAMKMAAVEKTAGSDTTVKTAEKDAEQLAKDLAEAKPVIAPEAPVVNASTETTPGSDTTVKTVEKDAETLAKELAEAKPVMAPPAPVMNSASVEEVDAIKNENESLKEKIQLLETAAVKILERKNVLGKFGENLSDKDILEDDKFEVAKLKMENAQLKKELNTSSSRIGERNLTNDQTALKSKRQEIDEKAFGPVPVKNKK